MADDVDLRGIVELLDAAGDQVVFQSQGEPPVHTRRLMETLGVRVEVVPVRVDAHTLVQSHDCRQPNCPREANARSEWCGEHTPKTVEKETPMSGASNGAARWTRDEIVEAIQAHAREHGAPPTSTDWTTAADGRPSADLVKRRMGSWAAAIVAAGFERPVRGGRPLRRPRAPQQISAREPAVKRVESSGGLAPCAPSTGLALGSVEPGSRAEAPDPGVTDIGWVLDLRLTGDFPRDAERVRTEAAVLRRQADALDAIAAGIDLLAEAAA